MISCIISDVLCAKAPPNIPTHQEYVLAKDDGTVLINSLVYPELTRTKDLLVNSSRDSSLLPRNFDANLTYTCGSARLFNVGTHKMTYSQDFFYRKTTTTSVPTI